MSSAAQDLHDRRTYDVSHRTTYTYETPVSSSYGRAILRPRPTGHQVVQDFSIEIEPVADTLTEHRDFFGNYSHYFEVRTEHTQLQVHKSSAVTVEWPRVDVDMLNRWTVASAAAQLAAARGEIAVQRDLYLLPSTLVEPGGDVARYAERELAADRPLGEALVALTHRIHEDFDYRQGATSVTTTLGELLSVRAGVCQDFSHLAVGCLRAVGIPARYVSGYLETAPPPGRPRLQGADASHAWSSVLLPEHGWVDLDPTNDHFADSRYIVTAWGRDFRDVSPMRGVIYTEGRGSTLSVAVDVTRRPDHEGMPT